MRSRFPWLEYEYADDPEDHSGEVETHVLSVNLSDMATKFLEVEEFFKTSEEPARENIRREIELLETSAGT